MSSSTVVSVLLTTLLGPSSVVEAFSVAAPTTTATRTTTTTRPTSSSSAISATFIQQHHRQKQLRQQLPDSLFSSRAVAVAPWRRDAVRLGMSLMMESDFGSAMPSPVSPYERIGITSEQLALGVDPEAFANYIGSREDLVTKTLSDIPSFDRATAEAEVDKFLLDADMINIYIEFQKRRAEDPDFKVPEPPGEGLFSLRNLVVVYLIFIFTSSTAPYVKPYLLDQLAERDIALATLPTWFQDWLTAVPAVTESADTDAAATATVDAAVDVVTDALTESVDAAAVGDLAVSAASSLSTTTMAVATHLLDNLHILPVDQPNLF